MQILVLGGHGFIGKHISEALVNQGHKLRIFDRTPYTRNGVENISADFSDSMALSEALIGIDLVLHMISTSIPSTSNDDPISDINGNLINTIKLLELMNRAKVKRIVYFSSGGTVYGIPQVTPMNEDHPTNPLCSYGVVKLAIEKYLLLYQHLYNINATILRPSNPYGPGQKNMGVQGFIGTCINCAINQSKLTIWGDGKVVRDYIFISDLTNATIAAIEKNAKGIFNLSSGQGYSINDIIKKVEGITGSQMTTDYQPKRTFDIPEMILDNNLAKTTFNWEPKINIDSGLEMSFQFSMDR